MFAHSNTRTLTVAGRGVAVATESRCHRHQPFTSPKPRRCHWHDTVLPALRGHGDASSVPAEGSGSPARRARPGPAGIARPSPPTAGALCACAATGLRGRQHGGLATLKMAACPCSTWPQGHSQDGGCTEGTKWRGAPRALLASESACSPA